MDHNAMILNLNQGFAFFYGFLTLFRVQYNILFMAAMILGGSDEKISV
jgi:hypothetical protein